MKRHVFLIIWVVLLELMTVAPVANAQQTMTVQVKEGELRATPHPLGKIIGKTLYGSKVTVLEDSGAWKKVAVTNGNMKGWMHNSALTAKKIALKSGQHDVQTSVGHNEISLAGKGFTEEIENEFRKKNKNLDFAWIDRMEKFNTPDERIREFIEKGGLSLRVEGGKP